MHQLYPPPNPNPQLYRHHVLRPATTPTTTKHGHNHVSSCGFPAASDGALERVNQAIQEYRRDVTQLDMSAYYTTHPLTALLHPATVTQSGNWTASHGTARRNTGRRDTGRRDTGRRDTRVFKQTET